MFTDILISVYQSQYFILRQLVSFSFLFFFEEVTLFLFAGDKISYRDSPKKLLELINNTVKC